MKNKGKVSKIWVVDEKNQDSWKREVRIKGKCSLVRSEGSSQLLN